LLCSFKRGFSHWSRLLEREKRSLSSQLLWLPSVLAVFGFLSATPQRRARPHSQAVSWGCPKAVVPVDLDLFQQQRRCDLLGETVNPWGLAEGPAAPPFPLLPWPVLPSWGPSPQREATARWERGRKAETRMWLTEAKKK